MKKQPILSKDIMPLIKKTLESQSVRLTISGQSMYPFFKDKQTIVTLEPINNTSLKKYDIVLFQLNDNYIIHRIINKNDPYVTQGDHLYQTEHVPKESIFGIVTSYETNGKKAYVRSVKHQLMIRLYRMYKTIRFFFVKIKRKL